MRKCFEQFQTFELWVVVSDKRYAQDNVVSVIFGRFNIIISVTDIYIYNYINMYFMQSVVWNRFIVLLKCKKKIQYLASKLIYIYNDTSKLLIGFWLHAVSLSRQSFSSISFRSDVVRNAFLEIILKRNNLWTFENEIII